MLGNLNCVSSTVDLENVIAVRGLIHIVIRVDVVCPKIT